MQYIQNLDSPQGKDSYDEASYLAISKVRNYWNTVVQGIFAGNEENLALVEDWNLDTSKDNSNTYSAWRVKMQKIYTTVSMSIVLMISVCAAKSNDFQDKMHTLASALTKLSASVEATVRYDKPDQNLSSEQLLDLSTKKDVSLKEPFLKYTVKILRQNRHAIVLVCTEDGTKALLEVAGCTAEVVSHHWMPKERPACVFTLSSDVCNE